MKKYIFLTLLCSVCCSFVSAQTYTLEQLKDSALKHNNAMRAARFDVEAARQQRREAFTKYFPNVSGTAAWFNANKHIVSADVNPAEYIPQSLAATMAQVLPAEALAALASPVSISMLKDGVLAGVNAVQPVFAGGQIINGNRLAKVGEDVGLLKLQLTENEVTLQTEQYYWQLVSLNEKVKTLDAVDSLLAGIGKDVEVAVRAGIALRNDLLQVQLRQNDVASQRLKLQNGISLVQMLLGQYCGLSSSEFIVHSSKLLPTDSINAEPDYELCTMNCALTNLPEYQLLQKQVEAARLQHRMEVGSRLPSVGVGVGYNYNNLVMKQDMSFGMVFATVSVPLSDWWGGSHAIKRKKIAVQKAEEQLADNAEMLTIRMRKTYNDMEEALQQVTLAKKGIEQAEENLRLNRDYYRAGTSRMADLLEAQLLYQQTCDRYVEATADYQIKKTLYRQAMGR